jgi:hypothetical protein
MCTTLCTSVCTTATQRWLQRHRSHKQSICGVHKGLCRTLLITTALQCTFHAPRQFKATESSTCPAHTFRCRHVARTFGNELVAKAAVHLRLQLGRLSRSHDTECLAVLLLLLLGKLQSKVETSPSPCMASLAWSLISTAASTQRNT